MFDYEFLKEGCLDAGDFYVIHLHKLLLLKSLGMQHEKYHHDLELIVKEVLRRQYAGN